MHPIQALILEQLDQARGPLTPPLTAPIEAALARDPSTAAVDAACVVVGLLGARGERAQAEALAMVVARVTSAARAAGAEVLELRGAALRSFSGRAPEPVRSARPAGGVPLASLYVPRRFG
jgi:hypothetical protein